MSHCPLPRTLHLRRPKTRSIPSRVQRARWSPLGPSRPFPHRHQRANRRRRYLLEALGAGLATILLTGVAVGFPAVLRQSPLTSVQHLAGMIAPSMAPSDPSVLIDCP